MPVIRGLSSRAALAALFLTCLVLPAPASAVGVAPVFVGAGGHYRAVVGAKLGVVVGRLRASDPDSASLTYAAASGSDPRFAISSNGVITVAAEIALTAGISANLLATVSDGQNETTAAFTVLIQSGTQSGKTGVSYRRYDEIDGEDATSIETAVKAKVAPAATGAVTQIDFWAYERDRFGIFYSGYIKAPTSNDFYFWLAADDSARFYLSSDASPNNLPTVPTAFTPSWSFAHDWNKHPSGRSKPQRLVAGQLYYFQYYFKEGGGAENISLGWSTTPTVEDGTKTIVIPPSAFLQSNALPDFVPPTSPRQFTVEYVTASAVSMHWRPASDYVAVAKYRVFRDGSQIAELKATSALVFNYTDQIATGTHTYEVRAVDAIGNASPSATIEGVQAGVAYTDLAEAMKTGNAGLVLEPNKFLNAAITQIKSDAAAADDMFHVWNSAPNGTGYNYSYWGNLYSPAANAPSVQQILRLQDCENQPCQGASAVAGFTNESTRMAAFGDTNGFYEYRNAENQPVNGALGTPLHYGDNLTRGIEWLVTGRPDTAPNASLKVGIVNTESTLISNFLVTRNLASSGNIKVCDQSNFADCFKGRSLVILGSNVFSGNVNSGYLDAIKAANTNHTPMLFMEDVVSYYGNDLSREIGKILGFAYWDTIYWYNHRIDRTPTQIAELEAALTAYDNNPLYKVLQRFVTSTFDLDFSGCEGGGNCDGGVANGKTFLDAEWEPGVGSQVRDALRNMDEQNFRLWDTATTKYRLLKLAVLLGDAWRQEVDYPFSIQTTPEPKFFRNYFADSAVYNSRDVNPAAPDLGTFSGPLSSSVPRFDTTFSTSSRKDWHYTSAEAYALPGSTVTITRTDNSSAVAKVFVNPLRHGGTKTWEQYERPKYLQSAHMQVNPGQSIKFTSAFGGPIQVEISGTSTPQPVSFNLSNVGKHPVWNGAATTAEFTKQLADSPYNWVEFKTSGFELLSRIDLMRKTLNTPMWDTPEELAYVIPKFFYASIYNTAGFAGPNLELSSTSQALCQSLGWTSANGLSCTDQTVHAIPSMLHFNSDVAACGYGCSGNPYDAYWPFSVLGWGDAHELGHNIQSLHIYGVTGEASNNVFPLRVLNYWNQVNPDQYFTTSHSGYTSEPFAVLKDSLNHADPGKYAFDILWADPTGTPDPGAAYVAEGANEYRIGFYLQLVDAANAKIGGRAFGQNGWDLITALYLHRRMVAASDESNWEARKQLLGLSDYTVGDAQALNSWAKPDGYAAVPENDLMLMETSFIMGRDMRPFFDMWGVKYSAKASAQVAKYGLTAAPRRYWYHPTDSNGVQVGVLPAVGSVLLSPTATLPDQPLNITSIKGSTLTGALRKLTQGTAVTITATLGAAGTVTFKAGNTAISGCEAVATVQQPEPEDVGLGEFINQRNFTASCSWTPPTTGWVSLTSVFVPESASKVGSTSAAYPVQVAPIPVLASSIAVTPTSFTVKVGATQQLTTVFTPTNTTDKTLAYTSSDSSIASVSKSGLVTGAKPGKATITVSTSNGKTATVVLTVTSS